MLFRSDHKFTTRAFATGVPTTLAGTPVVDIYEDNSLTQITGAETLTVDFDSVTGLNNLRIAMTAANGFATDSSYSAVVTTGTVGGTSVVGEVIFNFTVEKQSALRPSTAGRTLQVDANNRVDVGAWLGTSVTTSSTSAKPEVDAFSISDDATAANNLEVLADGVELYAGAYAGPREIGRAHV